MRKTRSVRRIPEVALSAVRGGDGGGGAPPPPDSSDLKQHVDNPGQTPMKP